ncbi:hypothetical protein MCERE155_00467 [Candidatus Nanopelagicaceae bacterium]
MSSENTPDARVEIGQIRMLAPDPGEINFESDSKLVVVLEDHSSVDGTFSVAYLDYLSTIATDRDFILPSTETQAPFDVALWIDFTARVLKEQLIVSQVMGLVDKSLLKQADNLAAVVLDGGFHDFRNRFSWKIGDYVPFYGDKIWLRRSNVIDSLNEISVSLDSEATMSRFLRVHIMSIDTDSSSKISVNSVRDAQIVCEFNIDFARAVLV